MAMAAEVVTGGGARAATRGAHALKRTVAHAPAEVAYFHQADDPYSCLACQVLARFADRYDVKLTPYLVSPPDDAAAPERERLGAYGLRDANRVARARGLAYPEAPMPPLAGAIGDAQAALAQALHDGAFLDRAPAISRALWFGDRIDGARTDPTPALQAGDASRDRLGHYLGAMFSFEGEWFWGVDRLGYLERRLAELGLDRAPGAPPIAPFLAPALGPAAAPSAAPVIEFWFSFRSPYSWLAMPRIRALADHYGATLELRPILPMVMRGLPVPRIKSRYIVLDCKREADRLGLPFGRIVDPVGAGAERALAVLHHAIPKGSGEVFAEAALRGAWAEGLALAEDRDLYAIAGAASLSHAEVAAALADESWRARAESNRAALFEAGLWGAPTFRVDGGAAHWGQDRLWALEEDILAVLDAARD